VHVCIHIHKLTTYTMVALKIIPPGDVAVLVKCTLLLVQFEELLKLLLLKSTD
jgi:hypothetical protein